jgi:DUF4097 and DUF4098 domain-containing protein YvlB
MSTPMSTPNPVPPYPYPKRARSLVGPIILIALGVFFMLATMGKISPRIFWSWFAQYWPVFLILWGAVRLVEYMIAHSKGQPAPRTGAGSIVFIVFFILIGLSATGVSRVNWGGISGAAGIDDPDINFFGALGGETYEFTETQAQPIEGGAQFKILARRGSIKIDPSPDAQAHIVVHKSIRGDSQDAANRMNQTTHPKFIQQGSLWILDATGNDYERGKFDFELQLPADKTLYLSTHRGDITVINRDKPGDVTTDHGDINLEQIKGNASLHIRSGSANVKDVTGDVVVDGEVEDGNVAGVTGSLDFNAGYNGEVQISKIGKQLRFKSVRTELQGPKMDGEVNMSRGNIRATGVSGPFRLETRSNDVRLEDATGDIHVENRNGTVELRTKLPLGAIEVNDTHGDVTVEVPNNANFVLDAESTNGNITSEFPGVQVDNQKRDATARGTVGKGGATMRLRSDRGTIQVRKQ